MRRSMLVTVALLYALEGLPFGVINELVPVWLKVHGASLETLGLLTLVGLPWTLKALWAPFVDRVGTAARWVSGALIVVGLGTAALPHAPERWLWVALVAVAMASATQDVAIDGYTATVVPERLHGRVNGLRVAAYRVAMLLAGGGAVALAEWVDWRWLFLGVGVLALAMVPWTARIPTVARSHEPVGAWLSELWRWLARDGALPALGLLGFVLLFKIGDAAMAPMVKPFWLDAGLSVAEVGLVSITLGTSLTVLGALVGGELTTRMGLFRGLWVLGLLQAVTNLGYAAVALAPSRWGVYAASVGESFAGGLGTAAYLAFLMRLCEGRQAATRFAILTALAGLTRTLSGAASGFGARHWGYAGYFAFTFVLALLAFALLPAVRGRIQYSEGSRSA